MYLQQHFEETEAWKKQNQSIFLRTSFMETFHFSLVLKSWSSLVNGSRNRHTYMLKKQHLCSPVIHCKWLSTQPVWQIFLAHSTEVKDMRGGCTSGAKCFFFMFELRKTVIIERKLQAKKCENSVSQILLQKLMVPRGLLPLGRTQQSYFQRKLK